MAGDRAVSGKGMNVNRGLSEKAPSMAHVATGSLVRQLGSLFEGGSVAGLSDRQLLERFIAGRDAAGEAAFAALVARHGPMVLGVCRQLLGDRHHAEDAFQAVFLVLARKARLDPRPRPAGQLALRRRAAHRAQGPRPARPPSTDRGGRRHETSRGSVPPCQAEQAIDREQAEALHARSTACPEPSAWRSCSATSRASRSTRRRDGCDGPAARSAAGWPGRARSSAAA